MCEQLQLFAEMKYWPVGRIGIYRPESTGATLLSRAGFKFRNPDLGCTIPRNKPRLQYINSIGIRGKSNDWFLSWKLVGNDI